MIVYVYRWKESLNMCLAYETHLSYHIDKCQIKKQHPDFNKHIDINQNIIRFRLYFPLKKRIFALLSEESPVWLLRCTTSTLTLYRYNSNTAPLARITCTAFTAFPSPLTASPRRGEWIVKSEEWKMPSGWVHSPLLTTHYSLLTFLCTSFIPTIGFSALCFVRSHLAEITRWEFF